MIYFLSNTDEHRWTQIDFLCAFEVGEDEYIFLSNTDEHRWTQIDFLCAFEVGELVWKS